MVLKAEKTQRRTVVASKVAGGKDRDPGRGRPEKYEKDAGQGIEAQMDRQIRQADRKRQRLYRCDQTCDGLDGESEAAQGAEGKQRSRDQPHALRPQQTGQSDQTPNTHEGEAGADR